MDGGKGWADTLIQRCQRGLGSIHLGKSCGNCETVTLGQNDTALRSYESGVVFSFSFFSGMAAYQYAIEPMHDRFMCYMVFSVN